MARPHIPEDSRKGRSKSPSRPPSRSGSPSRGGRRAVERVQTGVRIEKSLLKVLKGVAEYCDLSLGNLLEGIVLSSFEGKSPFVPETLAAITRLREIYGCDLTAADSHRMLETGL